MTVTPTTAEVISTATEHLHKLGGHVFDLLTVTKPITPDAAVNLSKVISKLSPLLGNMIEFNTVEFLNDQEEFHGHGEWERQDPGFPDTVFIGVDPTPGFEIKAWFPLATEITARFKDSQNHFTDNNTYVCMLAWLPEHILYGKPYILDVVVVSGASVAKSRDNHYHNPPDYLVMEPEDTTERTRNLQQTNTNGYKLQTKDPQIIREAEELVRSWGNSGHLYEATPEYQAKLRELFARYPYRLDTNYAKMDRIVHDELEAFKTRVLDTEVHGLTVRKWDALFRGSSKVEAEIRKAIEKNRQDQLPKLRKKQKMAEAALRETLERQIGITEGDTDELLR